MMKEVTHMKYLKIEDNKGYLYVDGSDWIPLDEITKDHILDLLDKALSDDFEMDEYEKEIIDNQTHKIIYKNIYEKFYDLHNKRTRFKDESETLFNSALAKYKQ